MEIKDKIKQKLVELNPHWNTGMVDLEVKNFVRRTYFTEFFKFANQFDVVRAIILMGPRRVGKTIILWQTIQEFIDLGKNPQDLIYIPLDLAIFAAYSLEDIIDVYKEIFVINDISGKVIIFDEVQSLRAWDRELKTLVDQYRRTKFIASGSAAGALNRQSIESGAGRFIDFILPPLTFCEYIKLLNLTDELLIFDEAKMMAIGSKDIFGLNHEFVNYINYGGFPEAIFNEAIRKDPTKFIRESIIEKVLQKDLPLIYGIRDVKELEKFFNYLTSQTGSEISYQKLCKESGITKPTIMKYIEFLEAAFLIKVVKRIDETGGSLKRNDFLKIYITNPSIYSAVWGIISENDTETLGHLVETAIYSQFTSDPHILDKLCYCRFKRGIGEIDMVHLGRNFKLDWCMEIKWSDLHVERYLSDLKNLLNFCEENKIKHAYITTKSIHKNIVFKDIKLEFMEAALVAFNIGHNKKLYSF